MQDDAGIIAEMQDDIRRLKGRPDPGAASLDVAGLIADSPRSGFVSAVIPKSEWAGAGSTVALTGGQNIPGTSVPFLTTVRFDSTSGSFGGSPFAFSPLADGIYHGDAFAQIDARNGAELQVDAYLFIHEFDTGAFDIFGHAHTVRGGGQHFVAPAGMAPLHTDQSVRFEIRILAWNLPASGTDTVAELYTANYPGEPAVYNYAAKMNFVRLADAPSGALFA